VETLMPSDAKRKRDSAQPQENIVVIGGGANGLVAAFYLAKAGHPTLLLERRPIIGGSLVTEEIHPGFHCPTVLHTTPPLPRQVSRAMQLDKQGLEMIKSGIRVLALNPAGEAVRIYEDAQQTASELVRASKHDAQSYLAFQKTFQQLGRAIAPLLSMTPPDMEHPAIDDYLNIAKLGLNFKGLDKKEAYRLLRWAPMAVADLTREWFETDLLRAVFEARGIVGTFAGPWSAGTSAGLLMQAAADAWPVAGASFCRGGIGAITRALAKSASAAGAQIRTGAAVARIQVSANGACGVVLEGGEEITARAVVSSADPKHTFLKLVDSTDLDPGFLAKIDSYRATGTVAKVNFALSRLPAFTGVKNESVDLSGRIHIGPGTDYLELAFDAAKYGDFSAQPYLDVTVPSVADPSLAPKGAHVMSVQVQYAPYKLKSGDWTSRRDELADTVVKTLSEYAADLRDTIVSRQILTPVDLEQTYGLTGGHIFHGEHTLDQLFAFRPLLGWAQYRSPIKHLYICGSGTHPGGAMTGASGANASREILQDLK
jgi:phytoene dehydrogenase-like protein